MADPNAHITAYLDRFLEAPADAHAAVLIDGPWGSGKTHFVKAHFEEKPHLYFSLFAVRNREEFRDQAIGKSLAILDGKEKDTVNFFGSILKGSVDLLSGGNIQLPYPYELHFERIVAGKTVILDDLERCPGGADLILAIAAELMERHKCKVVLLANRAELVKKNSSYEREEEKVVQRRLEFRPHFEATLGAFATAAATQAGSVDPELADKIAKIATPDLFANLEITSHRVARSAIFDAALYFMAMKSSKSNNEVIAYFGKYVLALSALYNIGRWRQEQLKHPRGVYSQYKRLEKHDKDPSKDKDLSDDERRARQSFIEQLDRYSANIKELDWHGPASLAEMIVDLIVGGRIDQRLAAEIDRVSSDRSLGHDLEIMRKANRAHSPEEIKGAFERIEAKLEDGAFPSFNAFKGAIGNWRRAVVIDRWFEREDAEERQKTFIRTFFDDKNIEADPPPRCALLDGERRDEIGWRLSDELQSEIEEIGKPLVRAWLAEDNAPRLLERLKNESEALPDFANQNVVASGVYWGRSALLALRCDALVEVLAKVSVERARDFLTAAKSAIAAPLRPNESASWKENEKAEKRMARRFRDKAQSCTCRIEAVLIEGLAELVEHKG